MTTQEIYMGQYDMLDFAFFTSNMIVIIISVFKTS